MFQKFIIAFFLAFGPIVMAQPSGVYDEVWYLRYIYSNDYYNFVPLNENFNLQFFENTGGDSLEAHGVENTFSAAVVFTSGGISVSNITVTSENCTEPNCTYEDLYFYELLSTLLLEDRDFIYNYNEYSQDKKDLWIRNDDAISAYFTNQPIEVDPSLFQTWYLYEIGVDLGSTNNVYGPDVPSLTINSDLTFTGTNGNINFNGNFIYGEDFVDGFKLVLENLSNPNTGIPDLVDFFPLTCYVEPTYFSIESYPGFYSAFNNYITLGIPESEKKSVKIYPNPVRDNISIESLQKIERVVLYSLQGEKIYTFYDDPKTLDLSKLSSGIYLIEIETASNTQRLRIVKQ